jgi:hypothetical protein
MRVVEPVGDPQDAGASVPVAERWVREHIASRVDLRTTQIGTWPSSRARPRGSDRSVVHNRVAPLHERDRAGRGSTPVDSLLHDESESTMSILQDPVRPLDPSSQQEFVERGREAEAERAGRSRSRKLVVWPPFVSKARPRYPRPQWAGASRSAN